MKIGIVVHGRFHAFDLARELIRAGHDVCLMTNYPKRVVEKFGIPRKCVRSNLLHGIVSRVMQRLDQLLGQQLSEPFTHRWFGTWSAKLVAQKHFDVVHGFSGVLEETLRTNDSGILKTLVRGSAHIETQYKLLAEEEQRTGLPIEKPSPWIRAREKREYELADLIFVLSSFAWASFVESGIDVSKLRLLPLGAQLAKFRPSAGIVQQRCTRIRGPDPLRVLTVGNLSLQKGTWDLATISKALHGDFIFRCVGGFAQDTAQLAPTMTGNVEFQPKVPQDRLPLEYAWADIFLFPTIQDGYAVVLAQAAAAGLPALSTSNCAGPDLIIEGATGWVFPIRRPELMVERLRWCDEHREELARMVENAYQNFVPRDWSDVARDFAKSCEEEQKQRSERAISVARV